VLAWLAGLGLLLTATSALAWWRARPVPVTAPPGAADPACGRLAARLPATVRGAGRVAASSDSTAVAAWGRPPVIWRCGVTPPGPTDRECLTVDGVDWVRVPLSDGSAFVTYGRSPAVQLLVPRGDEPEPLLLPVFSAAVAALPQGPRRCR
jgi:hypothetical protein